MLEIAGRVVGLIMQEEGQIEKHRNGEPAQAPFHPGLLPGGNGRYAIATTVSHGFGRIA